MSIGIYAFLRIYFLGFGVSVFAQFRTRRASHPAPCTATIYPARPVYRVQTGAACPASGRVCRCAVCCGHGLPCIWHGLCCCLCCAVRLGALGLWSPPEGYIAAAQPRPVSRSTAEKTKKTTPPSQNETHPIVQVSKNSKKYKKTHFGA